MSLNLLLFPMLNTLPLLAELLSSLDLEDRSTMDNLPGITKDQLVIVRTATNHIQSGSQPALLHHLGLSQPHLDMS